MRIFEHGGLAHLARALRWQWRGDRFESDILHETKHRGVQPLFDKTVPKTVPSARTTTVRTSFTTPFIHTGKTPLRIPRESTKLSEIAKNKWFVEFHFHDHGIGVSKRFRVSKNLNRLKEYYQKLEAFSDLLARFTNDLTNGWSPIQAAEVKEDPKVISHGQLCLEQPIQKFLEYHKSKGNRPKTIGLYKSKLKLFYRVWEQKRNQILLCLLGSRQKLAC